jgi:hypothetical protein
LLERQLLPGFKVGNKWCARKSTLTNFIAQLEQDTDAEMRRAAS